MAGVSWGDVEAHVTIVSRKEKGVPTVQCVHCDRQFTGGTTRVAAHLIGKPGQGVAACRNAPEDIVLKLTDLENQKRVAADKKRKLQMLDRATSSQQQSGTPSVQSTLEAAFAKADKSAVDAAVTKFFVANGLAFNVAKSKYWLECVKAIASFGTGYVPPKYDRLRGSLLDACVKEVKEGTNEYLETASHFGCTVTSDGWSNTQNRPLLNVLAVTATGAAFVKAVDSSGEVKDAQYIADELCKVIEDIGPETVVHVVTDNAGNCKAAGALIEARCVLYIMQ